MRRCIKNGDFGTIKNLCNGQIDMVNQYNWFKLIFFTISILYPLVSPIFNNLQKTKYKQQKLREINSQYKKKISLG